VGRGIDRSGSAVGIRGLRRATSGERVGGPSSKRKVAKHLQLTIAEGSFSEEREREQIKAQAAPEGLHLLRTTRAKEELSSQAVPRVSKQLKLAERAHRTIKTSLELRPIRHQLKQRLRCPHLLLAYHVCFKLLARLAPMPFSEQMPLGSTDRLTPAQRFSAAKANAAAKRTAEGLPAYSLTELIEELAALARNRLRAAGSEHAFTRPSKPTRSRPRRCSCATSSSPTGRSQAGPNPRNPATNDDSGTRPRELPVRSPAGQPGGKGSGHQGMVPPLGEDGLPACLHAPAIGAGCGAVSQRGRRLGACPAPRRRRPTRSARLPDRFPCLRSSGRFQTVALCAGCAGKAAPRRHRRVEEDAWQAAPLQGARM